MELPEMKVMALTLAKRHWVTGIWTFLDMTRKALEAVGIEYRVPDHWLNHRQPRWPLRSMVRVVSWLAGTPYEINVRRWLIGPALSGIARRESRFYNPDVLHIQGSLAAGLILEFLMEERVPWVLHLHSIDSELIRAEGLAPDHPLVILSDHLLRKSIASAPVVCAISRNLVDRIAALGIDVSRIRVVHNPIIIPELPEPPPCGPYVFLPARLSPEKGVDIAISAWKGVEKECPDVSLIIAGTGPQQDALMEMVQRAGATGIRFLGKLSWEETLAWTKRALVLLHPTVPRGGTREGLGMTVLEAMALGVPVISSDRGGAAEALGDAGIFVPPLDAEAMGQAIIRLIRDEALRHELSHRGIQRAEEMFGPDLYASKMARAFKDAVG
ncbi:MAG: glycosyltransferase family 4 protein [Candidatus Hydrothermia bacterium]